MLVPPVRAGVALEGPAAPTLPSVRGACRAGVRSEAWGACHHLALVTGPGCWGCRGSFHEPHAPSPLLQTYLGLAPFCPQLHFQCRPYFFVVLLESAF